MIRRLIFSICIIAFGAVSRVQAQHPISTSINSNWLFFKGDTSQKGSDHRWKPVSIPHTWNNHDVLDDEPGYYRGDGWYKKTLFIPSDWKDKDIYLYFEGVGQTAEVFVNGQRIGKHDGGYTYFSFPIHSALQFADQGNMANEVLIKVNNSPNENLPPTMGDFNIFGGVYRDVYLQVYDQVHFDADNHGTNGIFITTPQVSATQATVHIKGAIVNRSNEGRKLTISHRILMPNGGLLTEEKGIFSVEAGQKMDFEQSIKTFVVIAYGRQMTRICIGLPLL